MVSGITNLIALPIQLFLVGRLIGWFGLGNANLIFPAGTMLISGSLIFFPRLASAALGYFNRTTFRTVLRHPRRICSTTPCRCGSKDGRAPSSAG